MRHDLSVGFGGELVAFLLQLFFELEVVFDNAIVDDDDLAGAVAMRVGVLFSGAAMSGPARVADAVGAIQRRLGDNLLEIAKLTRGAADLQLAGLRHDGDARRIITAILKFAQSFDDDRHNFLGPDIANYSAHARSLLTGFPAA